MKYPNRVQDILNLLVAMNPALAQGSDDQRRALTWLVAEQLSFELGPSWGTKSADSGRPPSKDSIAFRDGAKLWSWDTINGSTREPNQFPDAEDITGQHFIPVPPKNNLGGTPVTPSAPTAPSIPTVNLSPLEAQVVALRQELAQQAVALADNRAALERIYADIAARIDVLINRPVPVPVDMKGTIFGVSVVLHPVK